MAPFPFPQLAELREKYTYNITPFPAPVRANSRYKTTLNAHGTDGSQFNSHKHVTMRLQGVVLWHVCIYWHADIKSKCSALS